MSKIILAAALLSLLILLVLSFVAPNNSVMWLASTSGSFVGLRIGLIAVLAVLLVTNPPRSLPLRIFVGLFSLSLIAWVGYTTYHYDMKFLDTFSLLAASVSSGIVVLELEDFDEENSVETDPTKLIHPHFGTHA